MVLCEDLDIIIFFGSFCILVDFFTIFCSYDVLYVSTALLALFLWHHSFSGNTERGEAVSRGDRKSESNLTITLLIAFSPGLMRLGLTLCIPLLIGLILSKTPERGIWGFIAGLFTFGLGIFQFTNSPLYSRLGFQILPGTTFLGIDFSICRIID